MSDGSDEVAAVVVAITPDGLRSVRDRHDAPEPVIRLRFDTVPTAQYLLFRNARAHHRGLCQ